MTDINNEEIEDILAEEETLLGGNELLTKKELQNSRSRLRNWISRDSANSEKRAKALASQLLSSVNNDAYKSYRSRRMLDESIISSIAGLCGKVLQSMNVRARVVVDTINSKHTGRPVTGWTDYSDIHIGIDTTTFDINSIESMTELLHVVKGLMYHEGGHIMWTSPLTVLCKKLGCTGEHHIKGLILSEYNQYMGTPEIALSFLSSLTVGPSLVHSAWNVLEDQRMEAAMVNESPIMAKYFSTIVAKYAIDGADPGRSWPWLIGRTYMPVNIRRAVRNEATKRTQAPIIPVIESVVRRYQRSNDPVEMHNAVLDMVECLIVWMDGQYSHPELDRHNQLGRGNGDGKGLKQINLPNVDGDTTDQLDDEANDGTDNQQSGDDRADSESDRSDSSEDPSDGDNDSGESPEQSGDTAGHDHGEKTISEQLQELAGENIASTNINEVTSLVSEINSNRNAIAPRDNDVKPMTTTEIKQSMDIRNGMLDVLDKLVVQVDPSWTFYQENGVLDPTAYLTREPGDMNFWAGMDGNNASGHNLAVSLLMDTSGSMQNRIEQVSCIAIGIRKACEHYDIPCTITTFSDQVRLFVAGDEPVEFMKMEAGGGTHIFDALTILDDQRYGRHNHLVVILTDGEWSDLKDVRIWGSPNRHIMIVGVGIEHYIISSKGANSAITINDISELAPLVTHAVAGYFAN